ncbi:MAG: hypothetical protein R2737_08270 [Candidatus Nanopelagicales bacterium]
MPKALYGHVGGPDPRLVAEVARLRVRVRELEAELARTRAAALDDLRLDDVSLDSDLLALQAGEPALA